jgi:hypothetical protein
MNRVVTAGEFLLARPVLMNDYVSTAYSILNQCIVIRTYDNRNVRLATRISQDRSEPVGRGIPAQEAFAKN